ncbi:Zn-dependent hydrolase [Agromyces tropicus]|uniref:Zn-dependent hydrolase n=1 Tax=Agromyces tropicus TaxID=555371 RepID=UPI0031DFF64D
MEATAQRVMARCDILAGISASTTAIERVHLSSEHARANELTARWMAEAGMMTRVDAAGNLLGRLDTGHPDAPALMLGSHLDTVPDAGRYDGILGVLVAIEVVRLLARRDEDGRAISPFPFALEVIAFADEEGTRFGRALLGSSAVAGDWNTDWWELTDADGTTLRDASLAFGLDPEKIGAAARRADELVGYLEAHIEQGTGLDDGREALGVVTSIASARRFEISVHGERRHAGGTTFERRRDALLGASEIALAVERISRAQHHVVGTVGRLQTVGGAVNIVPGETRLSLDLRGELDAHRDAVWSEIRAEISAIGERRGLTWTVEDVHNAPAVLCSPDLIGAIEGGIRTASTSVNAPAALFSKAGHDAMSLGKLTRVGMLFVRNADGVSHHPDESVLEDDVSRCIRALAESVILLAGDHA